MTSRRTVLKCCALATLPLAGCLGTADAGDDPSTTPPTTDDPGDSEPTDGDPADDGAGPGTDDLPGGNGSDDPAGGTRLRGTGGPGVTLVATDPTDGPVDHAVSVVREAATEEAPPGLEVAITNTSDASLTVGEGRAVVFAYRPDTAGHLVLLPADGEYPAEPGCWRLGEPVAVTQEYRTRTLAPGETATQPLDCYALPGEDACLPVGEYRFETTFRTGTAEDSTVDGGTERSWGFSVILE